MVAIDSASRSSTVIGSSPTSTKTYFTDRSRCLRFTANRYYYALLLAFFMLAGWIVLIRQNSYNYNTNKSKMTITTRNAHNSLGLRGYTRNDAIVNHRFDHNGMNNNNNTSMCRYYLAESAIPHGGLGLYTAIDLTEGQEAQSMPDICIYVADTPPRTSFVTHSWAKDVFIGQYEGKNPRAACEGFATLFNSMPEQNNIRTSDLVSMHHHTNGGLHRYYDPGAGAITHYYGISSVAKRNVTAGSELTINYGDWPYEKGKVYVAPNRTVDWLQRHGMCIDNIEIRPASNPSMGRGAFAKRSLPKGSLVAPAPIQMFPRRKAFANQVPEALFVNYCFQPPGTNILLFPYGPGVNLINHGSGKIANVKVEWSTHYMSHTNWLDLPLDQFWNMNYPGAIIMDVIAIRDINVGEEIFLDYGSDWANAWQVHLDQWKPVNQSTYTYVEEIDRTQPFRTMEEQEKEPYSPNLKTVCFTPNWDRDEYTTMAWSRPLVPFPDGLVLCNLLSRQYNATSSEYEYKVSLLFDRLEPDREDQRLYTDTNVPHSAISFVDKPYMSDLHLRNAFRHPIGLPEISIPQHWRE
jgi:hypothetical protein